MTCRATVLLVLGLLTATPVLADGIMSYTLLSGLIEYQGRILAGTIRWFFVNGVPAFREILYISTAIHFLRLYLWRANPNFDLPGETLKLGLTMLFLYTFLLIPAPATTRLYIYTEAKQVESDPDVQSQLNDININAADDRPISLVNHTAWTYIDLFSSALIEEVSRTVNGTTPGRRMPLLLQRALVNMQSVPMLGPATTDAAAQFRDGCRAQYLASPPVLAAGLTFLDALKNQPAPGINTSQLLARIYPPTRSRLQAPSDTLPSCAQLRADLLAFFKADYAQAISKFRVNVPIAPVDDYGGDTLQDPYSQPVLTEKESRTLVNLLATQQLGSILNNDNRTAPGVYQQPNLGNLNTTEASVNPNAGLIGTALTGFARLWAENITENPTFGNTKLTNELRHFYFRAPVLYGYAAVFFTIMAEFALVYSVIMGKFMYFWRAWAGMLALKCLPIIWIYAEGFLRGSLVLSAIGRSATTTTELGLDSGLYAEVYTRTLAILEITGMVNDYSFLLLIPFIPGVGDIARRVIG